MHDGICDICDANSATEHVDYEGAHYDVCWNCYAEQWPELAESVEQAAYEAAPTPTQECDDCGRLWNDCECAQGPYKQEVKPCSFPLKPKLSKQTQCLCCYRTETSNQCEIIVVDFKAKLVLSRRSA